MRNKKKKKELRLKFDQIIGQRFVDEIKKQPVVSSIELVDLLSPEK